MLWPFEKAELHEEHKSSLWRCELCDTFVSIHSLKPISQASCPTCNSASLYYCGDFERVLGMKAIDA